MKSALSQIPGKIEELIVAHTKELERAWADCAVLIDEVLTLSFSAKIGFDKQTKKPVCEVGINFTVEKVKDSKRFFWDDHQMKLAGVKLVTTSIPRQGWGTVLYLSNPCGETPGGKEMNIQEVYEKYKHLDDALFSKDWAAKVFYGYILRDLWTAIKQENERREKDGE